MNRVPSTSSVDFGSTPPLSAGSSYATSSTAQSAFYPNPNPPYPYYPTNPQTRQGQMVGQTPMIYHETPQGRVAIPMQGGSQVLMMNHCRYTPSPNPTDEGTFEPMDESENHMVYDMSPSNGYASLPHHGHQLISPTDEIRMHPQQHQQFNNQMAQRGRPPLAQRHSIQIPQQYQRPTIQRQMSLQVPQGARSASPHMAHMGDVFDAPGNGSPVRRPNSSLGHHVVPAPVPETAQDLYLNNQSQGITPSRALGPAPVHPYSFNSNGLPIITPNDKRGLRHDPSSVATTMTAMSGSAITEDSEVSGSVGHRAYAASSDEDNDSPTRASSARLKKSDNDSQSSRSLALTRQARPVTRPTVIGGRTSNKFSKVAEDPGVEGVPPGPRSMDRPGPSFACIIGQAILHSRAGGLSLEHIYRYVETAYPFFKQGDGAWRNSVRHNLSIHKMFETIPRTEKFPPGKGGIWIIHEDEKCHWPSEDRFVKNYPAGHPHHSQCRQTLHEAEKERQAKVKAEREGKVYIPKKAKKVKKGTIKDEDDEAEMMMRTLSAQSDGVFGPHAGSSHLTSSVAPVDAAPYVEGDFEPLVDQTGYTSIPPPHPAPAVEEQVPAKYLSHEETLAQLGVIVPQPFGSATAKRQSLAEDEDVFAGPNTKRVRIGEAVPLQELDHTQYLNEDFITPERERPGMDSSAVKHAPSSTLKTPALVNTSSSPGSSPMPPTLPRATHNPSGLHQGWTREDMNSSPVVPLEGALDIEIKPKAPRKHAVDDDFLPMGPPRGGLAPKTPVTRSSAHSKPRTPMSVPRAPLGYGSPAGSFYGDFGTGPESTPNHEVRGVIERMGSWTENASPSSAFRSPGGPTITDPGQYAFSSLNASPVKRRELSR